MTRMILISTLSLSACGKTTETAGGNARAPASGKNSTITLTWDARTGKAAQSFNVYGMPTPEAAEIPVVSFKTDLKGFDPKNPRYILDTTNSVLMPYVGKNFCFTVTAVVDGIESKPSQPSCQKI